MRDWTGQGERRDRTGSRDSTGEVTEVQTRNQVVWRVDMGMLEAFFFKCVIGLLNGLDFIGNANRIWLYFFSAVTFTFVLVRQSWIISQKHPPAFPGIFQVKYNKNTNN